MKKRNAQIFLAISFVSLVVLSSGFVSAAGFWAKVGCWFGFIDDAKCEILLAPPGTGQYAARGVGRVPPQQANCLGDGVIDKGEVCDGNNLNGQTCQSQGFAGGNLACNSQCNGFITSGCWSTSCTDSDGGQNYFVQGTIYGLNSSGLNYSDTDACGPNTGIMEFYCQGNQPLGNFTQCNNFGSNYTCQNGACVLNGTLNINSNPSSANIYDNNMYGQSVFVGLTPKNYATHAGSHTIRLTKPGYNDYITTVQVFSGQITFINAVLVANNGTGNQTNQTYLLTVSKTGNGFGTVTSNPAGINCGADCTQNYNAGTNVALTATPNAGSYFGGWSGAGCSGTGTCNVLMNANKNVIATFTLNQTNSSSPDLTVINLTVTNKTFVGNSSNGSLYSVTLTATVKSIGSGSAGSSVTRIGVDGVSSLDTATAALAPGQSTILVRGISNIPQGTRTARATADVLGQVTESNEGNNVLTTIFSVP